MGKKGGGNEAQQARADEMARQEKIRGGTKRVNSIFDGGTFGQGALDDKAVYDPTKTYYNADGSAWTPNGAGNAGVFGGNSFGALAKAGKLYANTKTTSGFNDAFFNGQRDNYLNYANPQLDDQYGDANKQLTFALDRSGTLDSSIRAQKASELQKLYDRNKQQVSDQALSYQNDAKTKVEDARSNLITTLNATGDAEGAANSAITRSATLSQPPAYSPLANLFADFTNGLGVQAAQERAAALSGGTYSPRYSTGLFGGGTGAVKVT